MIIVTFAGSGGYYGSYSTIYLAVDPAPTPATPIEPETPAAPEEVAETPFITTEIAIIAAVAVACVIGIVSFWTLRKRK